MAATKKQGAAERPNIVVIVAEELGAYMLGCYGNTEVQTPNIDRLAKTGVRFHNSFSCAPADLDQGGFSAAGYNCARGDSAAEAGDSWTAQAAAKPFFLVHAWPSPNAVAAPQKNLDLYAATGFETVGWDRRGDQRHAQGNVAGCAGKPAQICGGA